MADLDLSIAQITGITNKIKSITKLSSIIKTTTKNYNDFSTKIANSSTTNNIFVNIGNAVNNVNDKLEKVSEKSKKAGSGLLSLAKSALNLDNISKGMDMVDKYIDSGNSLARINDGLQTQMDLQNKVNAAATRSSTSYDDMVDAVSNIGSLDTFKNNDEAIAFTELIQKTLKVEGSDQSSADVTGMLSDGLLGGDEFSKLIADAPKIGEALADSTGLSMDQLQKLAGQGLISADILKKAMFAAGNGIEEEFAKQPKTFADIWTQVKNSATNALSPLMQLASDIINNPGVQAGIGYIISLFGQLSQVIDSVVGFVKDNWPFIESVLAAVGLYLAYLGATAFVSFMQATIAEIAAIAPILLIIGAILAVIYILTSLGVSFEDIFRFIGGVIGTFIAFFYNIFVSLWNFIGSFINFFGNVFNDPIASIKALFYDMVINVLGFIGMIAQGIQDLINKIPGVDVDITSNINKTIDKTVEKSLEIKNDANLKVYVETQNYMDLSNGADMGGNIGAEFYNSMSNLTDTITNNNYYNGTDNTVEFETKDTVPVEGTVNVNMEDEDLDYLRQMAERDYIANIATNTLAPNISVSFGDVHETANVDQLFGRIRTILQEQIAVAPEGVY